MGNIQTNKMGNTKQKTEQMPMNYQQLNQSCYLFQYVE